jgi:hypothetical protein
MEGKYNEKENERMIDKKKTGRKNVRKKLS